LLRIKDQLADNLYDEVSGIALTMAAKKTWDANCADMFERLEKFLTKKKYKKFVDDFRNRYYDWRQILFYTKVFKTFGMAGGPIA
jgi:hypothetical protein